LHFDPEPADMPAATDASVLPDSPDQIAQHLLISLLHSGRAPFQHIVLRKRHQLSRAALH
jgi:hypothetical protein